MSDQAEEQIQAPDPYSPTAKCDAAIARLQATTPDNWIAQAGKRMAARIKWMSEAYSPDPDQKIMAEAESELLAAGGDMCDLQLLRQRAQREFQSE
jgi:hypothetical protein